MLSQQLAVAICPHRCAVALFLVRQLAADCRIERRPTSYKHEIEGRELESWQGCDKSCFYSVGTVKYAIDESEASISTVRVASLPRSRLSTLVDAKAV